MGFWNAKVSDIKSELTDWLKTRGGSVSDLPLSLINRARQRIWSHRPWDFFITTGTLTLSNNSASLPTDMGAIVQIYHDSDSDGKPDWFYYRNDARVDHRYVITAAFTLAADPVWTITFPSSPASSPIVRYMKAIENCTADTNRLYFPAELVMRCAQLCHIIEKNLRGNEISVIRDDYERLLIDFEQLCQNSNNAMDMQLVDNIGDPIQTESYDIDGGGSNRMITPFDNSRDNG
jgi:hypothetical protein